MEDLVCALVGYNNWQLSENCIRSFAEAGSGAYSSIHFLNNGSTDCTAKSMPKLSSDVEKLIVYSSDKNTGFAKGYNYVLSTILDKYSEDRVNSKILVTNNDTVFLQNSVKTLVNGWDELRNRGEKVSFLAPLITYGCVREQIASNEHDKPEWSKEKRFLDSDFPHVCYLTTVEVLRDIGLYDESIAPHGMMEDIDMNWRARRLGYKLFIDSESFVFHHGSKTVLSIPNIHGEHMESQKKFAEKVALWDKEGRLK